MQTTQPQADKSWADRHPDQYVGSQEDEAAAKLKSHKEVEAYNQATVKEHEQLRSDNSAREIVQRDQRQVDNQQSEHTRQDEADVEKHLRQATLCSELDDQVADKVRVKGRNKEISDNFKETWCWGGDAASEVDKAAAKLKIYKDVDAYNKATVKEHQKLKSEKRTQEIMQREQRDLFIQESEHTRQDERDVDKQLRQSDLCSGLDRQVAEQLGVQEKARENSKHCNKKWMFGGDSTTEMDEAADTYKKGRECDEYNRATVREHEWLNRILPFLVARNFNL
uniref:Uncharacterized protein n=1 Tax=Cacopsylla melanoneura TaxID=428564 RepID=A0A8D8ZVK0_9HEMI